MTNGGGQGETISAIFDGVNQSIATFYTLELEKQRQLGNDPCQRRVAYQQIEYAVIGEIMVAEDVLIHLTEATINSVETSVRDYGRDPIGGGYREGQSFAFWLYDHLYRSHPWIVVTGLTSLGTATWTQALAATAVIDSMLPTWPPNFGIPRYSDGAYAAIEDLFNPGVWATFGTNKIVGPVVQDLYNQWVRYQSGEVLPADLPVASREYMSELSGRTMGGSSNNITPWSLGENYGSGGMIRALQYRRDFLHEAGKEALAECDSVREMDALRAETERFRVRSEAESLRISVSGRAESEREKAEKTGTALIIAATGLLLFGAR